jgi:predicted transcriptional regulator
VEDKSLSPNGATKVNWQAEQMSINEILEELPKLNPQELEEVSYRAQFLRALREGLKEITDGQLIPHEQVKKELAQWLSE